MRIDSTGGQVSCQKFVNDFVGLAQRKGLFEQGCDWKWSSAGWLEQRPVNDLEPDPIP